MRMGRTQTLPPDHLRKLLCILHGSKQGEHAGFMLQCVFASSSSCSNSSQQVESSPDNLQVRERLLGEASGERAPKRHLCRH